MRALALPFVALLLLAPLASAGTEEEPELSDPAGDTNNPALADHGDLLAAWIEGEDEESFTTVVKFATIDPAVATYTSYRLDFELLGIGYNTFSFRGPEGAFFSTGRWNLENDTFESMEAEGEWDLGSPAFLRVAFPKAFLNWSWESAAFLESPVAVANLSEFVALSFDVKPLLATAVATCMVSCVFPPQQLWVVDYAEGEGQYALTLPPEVVPVPAENETADGANATGEPSGPAVQSSSSASGDSPGLGLAGTVAVVVAVTAALRRRRA